MRVLQAQGGAAPVVSGSQAAAPVATDRMQRGGFPATDVFRGRAPAQKLPPEAWKAACRWNEATQYQTLNMVVQHVELAMRRYNARGRDKSIKRPVVVFDLDDTLFRSNQTRTWRILREWLEERPALPWDVRRNLGVIRPEALAYNNKDTFAKVGGLDLTRPEVKAALADFDGFWKERFFSNDYCQDDPLQYGGLELVKKVHDLGANIAYLTGRDEPRMGQGTRKAIAKSGLKRLSSRVKLFLKPHKDVDDAEFKKSVRDQLLGCGNVVATFDNAPANCVVLADSFPKAINVFVDTVYDTAPIEVRHGLFKIFDFSRRHAST